MAGRTPFWVGDENIGTMRRVGFEAIHLGDLEKTGAIEYYR